MRTSCYMLLFICAVAALLASESTEKEIQVTPTTTQPVFSVQVFDSPPGTYTFDVRATVKDHDLIPLDYGSLRVYDAVKLVSSCVVNHGYEKEGRVWFGFTVATNYCDFSKFGVLYGTNFSSATYYWFYLKDFCHAK